MSHAVNFHFIYPQQPSSRTINSHVRKQQPASKLINSYLSTAAQYLNRTKSFHIPQTTTFPSNSPTPIVNDYQEDVLGIDNSNLARSVPSSMNNLNPTMNYQEHRFESITNKSDGIVNSLRRSLRRSKEKFYNKRSTTMKSCNSLNHYEPSAHPQRQTSMTPNLICRHQYFENKIDSSMKNNSLNEESEMNDRLRKNFCFLQQLILKNNKSTLPIS
jgi:hypothetical protein